VGHNCCIGAAELNSMKEDFLEIMWYWVADEVFQQLFLVVCPVLLLADVWTLEEMVHSFWLSMTRWADLSF